MYQLRLLLLRAKKYADSFRVSQSDASSSGAVTVPPSQAPTKPADLAAVADETHSIAPHDPAVCNDNLTGYHPPHATSGGELQEEASSCAVPQQNAGQDLEGFLPEPTHQAPDADTGDGLPGGEGHPVLSTVDIRCKRMPHGPPWRRVVETVCISYDASVLPKT